ncbi:glycosyl hydrolase [uncultured Algibacter sp.]|uniref:glycosyl hydrolase n=1 Tax=uncultured Algibacter sp. TaxID=298659 RepID=UPI00260FFCB6|nr:glycosyl hydrolase [uncultured Algibacter sp.]
MKKTVIIYILNLIVVTFTFSAKCQSIENQEKIKEELVKGFQNPPDSAKPLTWMHVMSGNMSKVGITKDLEAIADVGIGGVLIFNITHNIPNGPIQFNSTEHIEMMTFAATECERLGLSFGIHNCDGWTASGGPWVPVEHSMKQLVYRETIIDGGEINMILPEPSKIANFYRDVAVLAYPALNSELKDSNNPTKISCSEPSFDINIATNGKIDERSELIVPKDGNTWIQWDFIEPFTVKSFLLKAQKQRYKNPFKLQSSNDGVHFKDELTMKMSRHGKYEYTIDETFEGITARYFRFVTNVPLDIAEISLTNTSRYNNMISRTSILRKNNGGLPNIKEVDKSMVINKDAILDLTRFMDDKGVLKTTLPKGKWTIMRFGYTTTGVVNDPASIAGTGLEVDKFSRESFDVFYEGHVQKMIDAAKDMAPNAFQFIEIDSYEVGGQNWTKAYEKQFEDAYGYDLIKFLPLYAGRYIDNAQTIDGVLWDIRNFNSKLMSDNYYGYFNDRCHADGFKTYLEPYGNAGFNNLDIASKTDIPMGEFHAGHKLMLRDAVSAAHIYGKNLISAEAFTSGGNISFEGHPGFFKNNGDEAFSHGVNEIMFHRFAHQANTHVKPGMGMSKFGSHIDRTQTWWDNAGKAWFKYLARSQYLLRKGIPVVDILAFVGDGSPNTTATRKGVRDLPNHINYDGINTDVLLNRVKVENGKLVLPEGGKYHALYLNNVKQIHLSTLKRIADLANQGVIVIGRKPNKIGGYSISEAQQIEFNQLLEKVWDKPTTYDVIEWETLYEKHNIPVDLKIKAGEHINYTHRKTANEDIYFFFNPDNTKRVYECTFNVDGRIPELWNPMNGETTLLSTFEHVDGKTKVSISMEAKASTFVVFQKSSNGINSVKPSTAVNNTNLSFKLNNSGDTEIEAIQNGLYEVAFTNGSKQEVDIQNIPSPILIKGDWKVTFPDLKMGSQTYTFPKLSNWTLHETEGVRHYSGTAIYQKTFKVDKKLLNTNYKLKLDLGQVNVIARVIINDQDMGVLWMSPHKVDITSVLKAGKNDLRIEVTNQWTNRLIGDENFPNVSGYDLRPHLNSTLLIKDPQLSLINRNNMVDWYTNNEPAPLGQRSTFTTHPFYKKGDDLLPAGLVGPVKIEVSKIIIDKR